MSARDDYYGPHMGWDQYGAMCDEIDLLRADIAKWIALADRLATALFHGNDPIGLRLVNAALDAHSRAVVGREDAPRQTISADMVYVVTANAGHENIYGAFTSEDDAVERARTLMSPRVTPCLLRRPQS